MSVTKEIEVELDDMLATYEVEGRMVDASFDHAFGTRHEEEVEVVDMWLKECSRGEDDTPHTPTKEEAEKLEMLASESFCRNY